MTVTIPENLPTESNLVWKLAHWLAGDFSNQKQAFANPKSFAHIRVFFRPLPWDFFTGIGFYSEQAFDYDLWNPYRQGVHRLVAKGNQIYIENYGLKNSILYAGAGREKDILKTITPSCIERRYNCSMIFEQQENLFKGRVEGQCCLIEKYGKKTYLVSEVELTETTFISLDRGLDVNSHEQIWGSNSGPLRFEKWQSYASEIPLISPESAS